MPIASGKTLGYGRVSLPEGGNCILYVSATVPASDRDWAEYTEWLRKSVRPGDKIRSLVFDRAGGPNATQRKQLNEITAPCTLSVAVISPSAVGRGVVTAMNWFKKDSYMAFMPNELDAAISALNITGAAALEVRRSVTDMLRALEK